MQNNLLPITRIGWRYIAYSFLVFTIFYLLNFATLAFISFLSVAFFAFIFRNPERKLPMFENLSVVSPCDGVVKAIENLNDSEYSYRVDIQSSIYNVGVLRVPFNATLEKVVKRNGTRVSQKSSLFNDINENAELIFVDSIGNKVKIMHRLRRSISPLYIDSIESKNVQQTSRYGMMNNGITSIYLPKNFRLNVNLGNELKAAESLLGYFS